MTYALPSPDEKQLLLTSSWATRPPELFVQAARAGAVPKAADLRRSLRPSPPSPGALPRSSASPRPISPAASRRASTRRPAGHPTPGRRRSSSSTARATCRTPTRAGRTTTGSSCSTPCSRAPATSCSTSTTAPPSGYGRDFRTAIYRQMGEPELEDLADGVAWLVAAAGRGRRTGRHLRRQLRRLPDHDGAVQAAASSSRPERRSGRSPTGRTTTRATPRRSSTLPRSTPRPTAGARRSNSPPASRSRCSSATAWWTTTSPSRTRSASSSV